ncbi:hypothetical protein QWZ16_13735 [Vibrio ostreicida]|uniref:Uncharacterized protein n=1 Tax=Vibrio ostreicida TaxID=526588 RepID=A0ABT8BXD6_9VIBR|nr:hypothetical protein [Vibrio ostreicida]MDN3610762.1 hypothetical protein [Vibrio ostreicida]
MVKIKSGTRACVPLETTVYIFQSKEKPVLVADITTLIRIDTH